MAAIKGVEEALKKLEGNWLAFCFLGGSSPSASNWAKNCQMVENLGIVHISACSFYAVAQAPWKQNKECRETAWNKHFPAWTVGWVSVPSNVSANDCRLCWQRAVFLPVAFQVDDAQALTKVVVMEGNGSTQGFWASSRYEGWTESGSLIVRLQTPQRVDKEIICNYSRKTQLTKVADSNLSAAPAMSFILLRDKTRIWISENALENMQWIFIHDWTCICRITGINDDDFITSS